MRFSLLALVMCLCLPLAGGVMVRMPSGESIQLYSDYLAVIVGNSDYQFYRRLPGAAKDVEEVAKAFDSLGIRVIKRYNLTSDELVMLFNDLVDNYGKNRERGLIFYFAGHGETEKRSGGSELGYILPVDTPLLQDNPSGFRAKAISMNRVTEFAELIESKHVLMFFDSCFSGTVFTTKRAAPQIISEKTREDVRQFITAGSAEETVPDVSIFRSTLVDALGKGYADTNSDGYITGEELGFYLENEVVNYSKGSQHPKYGRIANNTLDKGDFVFALKKEEAPLKPAAKPPAYTPPPSVEVVSLAGTFRITASEPGSVYVDGALTERINPTIELRKQDLVPGTHRVDFVSASAIMSVSASVAKSQVLEIHFDPGKIAGSSVYQHWTELKVDPPSLLSIDGFGESYSTGRYIFASDTEHTYTVNLAKADYEPAKIQVKPVGAGKISSFKMVSSFCGFTINSEPSGARVSMNGGLLGETPLSVSPMAGRYPSGEYLFTLELPDYFPVNRTFVLNNKSENNISVKMEQVTSGQLAIRKIEPGVSVSLLDDRSKTEAKYKGSMMLYSGTYLLQADRWGYIPRTYKIEVKPNRLVEIPEIKLDPIDKKLLKKYGNWKTYQTCSGLGILGTTALAAMTYYFANQNHVDYQNATTPSEAQRFRDRYNQLKGYYYATLGVDAALLLNYIFAGSRASSVRKSIDNAYKQYKM